MKSLKIATEIHQRAKSGYFGLKDLEAIIENVVCEHDLSLESLEILVEALNTTLKGQTKIRTTASVRNAISNLSLMEVFGDLNLRSLLESIKFHSDVFEQRYYEQAVGVGF